MSVGGDGGFVVTGCEVEVVDVEVVDVGVEVVEVEVVVVRTFGCGTPSMWVSRD